jgi:hypothetical protein
MRAAPSRRQSSPQRAGLLFHEQRPRAISPPHRKRSSGLVSYRCDVVRVGA